MIDIFYIFEPNLLDKTGHYYEYSKALLNYCHKVHKKVLLYGNINVRSDIKSELSIIPLFNLTFGSFYKFPIPYIRRYFNLLHNYNIFMHWKILYRDLKIAFKNINSDENSIFFFPTIDNSDVYAVIKSLINIKIKGSVVIFLRYTLNSQPNYNFNSKKLQRVNKLIGKLNSFKVFFVTDSELLLKQYQKILKAKISLLPIPHSLNCKESSKEKKEGYKIRITFLGPAHLSKGIYLLKGLFSYLNKENLMSIIDAHIQVNNIYEKGSKNYMIVEGVKKTLRNTEGVTIYGSSLDSHNFYDILNNADIVLLPYDTSIYDYLGTSGIFTEALARNKVVVASDNTWMALYIKKYNCGTIFKSGNGKEFIKAVLDGVKNYKKYNSNAKLISEKWKKYHSSENFFEQLEKVLKNE